MSNEWQLNTNESFSKVLPPLLNTNSNIAKNVYDMIKNLFKILRYHANSSQEFDQKWNMRFIVGIEHVVELFCVVLFLCIPVLILPGLERDRNWCNKNEADVKENIIFVELVNFILPNKYLLLLGTCQLSVCRTCNEIVYTSVDYPVFSKTNGYYRP